MKISPTVLGLTVNDKPTAYVSGQFLSRGELLKALLRDMRLIRGGRLPPLTSLIVEVILGMIAGYYDRRDSRYLNSPGKEKPW